MSDSWTGRLSEYLDGELAAADAALLEHHLRECSSCRRDLAELRAVVAQLRGDSLRQEDQPTIQAWSAIQHAIAPSRGPWIRRAAFAAALAGLVLAGGLWRRQAPGPTPFPGSPPILPADYHQAAADLEAVLREQRSQLRPETVRAVEASLAMIDTAIAQAARALALDPANEYITRYLAQLRDTRLTALRDAVALVHRRG